MSLRRAEQQVKNFNKDVDDPPSAFNGREEKAPAAEGGGEKGARRMLLKRDKGKVRAAAPAPAAAVPAGLREHAAADFCGDEMVVA